MSIRRYLVLTLFSALTLITFIAAIQGYKVSMSRAEKQFDQQLVDIANTLLAVQSISKHTKNISNEKPYSITNVEQQGSFAFQIWKNDKLLVKSNNAPDHLIITSMIFDTTANGQLYQFYDENFLNKRWRVFVLSNNNFLSDNNSSMVIVAQPLQVQIALAQELTLASVTPMIIAIVTLSFLIYIIITQGLKPLHQLRRALSNKNTNDFRPLNLQVNNTELADIIVTLNQLFYRLDSAFQREKHFAEDAAHELKTPLSVLKINVHNITQDFSSRLSVNKGSVSANEVSRFDSIKELTSSVDRMGHIIDQILNLNRTNAAQIVSGRTRFNLNLLLQQVIGELYSDLLAKEQTIELESDDIDILAHEFSVHLLAVNLISNANKYTPAGGKIRVTVKVIDEELSDREIVLCVEDSGVGIAYQEYTRVFDRFYRIGGDQHLSDTLGCGLGLTIVKHIADVHGASIKLSPSTLLQGLKIEVYFKDMKEEKVHADD